MRLPRSEQGTGGRSFIAPPSKITEIRVNRTLYLIW
jgi:hypothetical protein